MRKNLHSQPPLVPLSIDHDHANELRAISDRYATRVRSIVVAAGALGPAVPVLCQNSIEPTPSGFPRPPVTGAVASGSNPFPLS